MHGSLPFWFLPRTDKCFLSRQLCLSCMFYYSQQRALTAATTCLWCHPIHARFKDCNMFFTVSHSRASLCSPRGPYSSRRYAPLHITQRKLAAQGFLEWSAFAWLSLGCMPHHRDQEVTITARRDSSPHHPSVVCLLPIAHCVTAPPQLTFSSAGPCLYASSISLYSREMWANICSPQIRHTQAYQMVLLSSSLGTSEEAGITYRYIEEPSPPWVIITLLHPMVPTQLLARSTGKTPLLKK